jgi:hypothetical protein
MNASRDGEAGNLPDDFLDGCHASGLPRIVCGPVEPEPLARSAITAM